MSLFPEMNARAQGSDHKQLENEVDLSIVYGPTLMQMNEDPAARVV